MTKTHPEMSIESGYPITISTLAKAADTSVHTVRNYLAEGLISAHSRTKGGYWGHTTIRKILYAKRLSH